MELEKDEETNSFVIKVRVEDFMCMSHGALYASADTEYIKRFPTTSYQIVDAANRINSARDFIVTQLVIKSRQINREKSPDVPSQEK